MHSRCLKTFVYSGIRLFQAEGAIFQKIQEQGFAGHPNQTIQLRTEIKIPPEAVGRIIGRRGTKVIHNPSLCTIIQLLVLTRFFSVFLVQNGNRVSSTIGYC